MHASFCRLGAGLIGVSPVDSAAAAQPRAPAVAGDDTLFARQSDFSEDNQHFELLRFLRPTPHHTRTRGLQKRDALLTAARDITPFSPSGVETPLLQGLKRRLKRRLNERRPKHTAKVITACAALCARLFVAIAGPRPCTGRRPLMFQLCYTF